MKGYQIITFALIVLLGGLVCLKPPALPRWDVPLTIPVFSGSVRFGDIISASNNFLIQPDSSIVFYWEHDFGSVQSGGAFELLATQETTVVSLGDFLFVNFWGGDTVLTAEELLMMPIPDTGMMLVIPPFDGTRKGICEMDNIEFVELLEGVARVTVINQTPFNFDSVLLRILGKELRFGPLPPGLNGVQRFGVGGLVLQAPLSFDIAFGSAGSNGESLMVSRNQRLLFMVEFDSLRVGSGKIRCSQAQVERRILVKTDFVYPLRIDSAVLGGGDCEFVLSNDLPVPLDISYEVRKLGLNSEMHIEPANGGIVSFNLGGIGINNMGKKKGILEFRVRAVANFREDFLELNKTTGLRISYVTRGLVPCLVVGAFRDPVYVLARLETIPFPVQCIRIANAELALDITNGTGFPVDMILKLTAYREGCPVRTTERLLGLGPGSKFAPQNSHWTIPLTEIVNAGPEFITVEYNVRLFGYGRFTEGDFITGRAIGSAPLRIALVPDTVFLPERAVVTDVSEEISEYLMGGEAEVEVRNCFPIGLSGKLIIRRDVNLPREAGVLVDSVILPFGVPAGITNQERRCVAGQDTVIGVMLDSLDVTLFRSRTLRAGVVLELPATDTVVVYAGDRLGLDALVRLLIRVKD